MWPTGFICPTLMVRKKSAASSTQKKVFICVFYWFGHKDSIDFLGWMKKRSHKVDVNQQLFMQKFMLGLKGTLIHFSRHLWIHSSWFSCPLFHYVPDNPNLPHPKSNSTPEINIFQNFQFSPKSKIFKGP